MKVSELNAHELTRLLCKGNLLLKLGPFVVRLRSNVDGLAKDLRLIYAEFDLCDTNVFADFHVEIAREAGLRRWFKPLVRFFFDGRPSFIPLPAQQAFAMLEWGLNWCVASHSHQYLVIHAAVIEKGGKAAIFPAPPGSGKSTLCTGLVMSGWRLLSDELALYDLETGLVHGMSRPINLKNKSIEVIGRFAPDAVMTAPMPDTTKGTVALVRPPRSSVIRAAEPVRPMWIVLPKYVPNSTTVLQRYSNARTFMLIAEQSFNYDIQGVRGFEAIGNLIDQSECYQFIYSKLDEAKDAFESLLSGLSG